MDIKSECLVLVLVNATVKHAKLCRQIATIHVAVLDLIFSKLLHKRRFIILITVHGFLYVSYARFVCFNYDIHSSSTYGVYHGLYRALVIKNNAYFAVLLIIV